MITGLTSLGYEQESIVLPAITTSLKEDLFQDNKNIKYVDMSLTKITHMPNGYANPDGHGFKGLFKDSTVIKVILPNNLQYLGSRTFQFAGDLETTKIPETVTDMSGDNLFYYCTKLKNISLPKNVRGKLGQYCFANNLQMTSMIIPNGVTELGERAFFGCNKLSKISLPNSLKTIRTEAFYRCSSLEEITLPDSITLIETNAFIYDDNLVIKVTSDRVENLVKAVFSGTVINLNKSYRKD